MCCLFNNDTCDLRSSKADMLKHKKHTERNLIMIMKKNVITTLVIVFSFICCISTANSLVKADELSITPFLGAAGEYNDVFFGNYSGIKGDIEGHAAIEGDVDVQNYSFGAWQKEKHTGRNVLVIGGNATISSTTVHDGDAYIGGTLSDHSGGLWNALTVNKAEEENNDETRIKTKTALDYDATPGTVYVQDTSNFGPNNHHPYQQSFTDGNIAGLPFDFDAAKQHLQNASSYLSDLESTVDAEKRDGGLWIDLEGKTGLQVVTLEASLLDAANLFIINGTDTTLIINVINGLGLETIDGKTVLNLNEIHIDGENDVFTGDFDGSNILFNVDSSINQINVSSANINASVLAIDTDFDVQFGHISGQVFGASAHTENGGEFHAYYTFDDKHLTNGSTDGAGATTPEPATLLMLGFGLAGIPVVRRFRKK